MGCRCLLERGNVFEKTHTKYLTRGEIALVIGAAARNLCSACSTSSIRRGEGGDIFLQRKANSQDVMTERDITQIPWTYAWPYSEGGVFGREGSYFLLKEDRKTNPGRKHPQATTSKRKKGWRVSGTCNERYTKGREGKKIKLGGASPSLH